MHGHSFKIIVAIRAPLQHPQGWVMDYNEISVRLKPLLQLVDHNILNNVAGLENPTSEHLSQWFYERSQKIIPEIFQITIMETSSTEVIYPT